MTKLRCCGELGENLAREIARGDFDEPYKRGIDLEKASYLPQELIDRLIYISERLKPIDDDIIIDRRRAMMIEKTDLTLDQIDRILQEEA